jgi:hypothetical protein
MSGISDFYGSFELTESVGASYLFWPLIVFIVMAIIFGILLFRNKGPGIKDYMPSEVSLNTATNVIGSNEAHTILLSGPGATLAGLFKVTIGDKTTQTATPTTNNFSTLFGIRGSIEFQLAPANISNPNNTAQLLITTNARGADNAFLAEAIPLPPLPAQKWTFIAILRDGRRFDVLYNDQVVGSHRLTYYPNTGVQNQLQVGQSPLTATAPSRFLGSAKHLFAFNYRMAPGDLAALRAKYVDTTGAPPIPLPFPSPFNLTLPGICSIPGLPCNPVNQPPPNSLQAWSTPYS